MELVQPSYNVDDWSGVLAQRDEPAHRCEGAAEAVDGKGHLFDIDTHFPSTLTVAADSTRPGSTGIVVDVEAVKRAYAAETSWQTSATQNSFVD